MDSSSPALREPLTYHLQIKYWVPLNRPNGIAIYNMVLHRVPEPRQFIPDIASPGDTRKWRNPGDCSCFDVAYIILTPPLLALSNHNSSRTYESARVKPMWCFVVVTVAWSIAAPNYFLIQAIFSQCTRDLLHPHGSMLSQKRTFSGRRWMFQPSFSIFGFAEGYLRDLLYRTWLAARVSIFMSILFSVSASIIAKVSHSMLANSSGNNCVWITSEVPSDLKAPIKLKLELIPIQLSQPQQLYRMETVSSLLFLLALCAVRHVSCSHAHSQDHIHPFILYLWLKVRASIAAPMLLEIGTPLLASHCLCY